MSKFQFHILFAEINWEANKRDKLDVEYMFDIYFLKLIFFEDLYF